MSREQRTPGWLIVETMSGKAPSIVFDADNTREFKRLSRRENFRTSGITDSLLRMLTKAVQTSKLVEGRTALPDGTDVYVQVLPIFGPNYAVYGAQIWLGQLGDEVTKPRNVEAWSYDIEKSLTHHGPGVDRNILSINAESLVRPSHDRIFSFHDNFALQTECGLYTEAAGSGRLPIDTPFQADISLTDGRGIGRNIHVSTVNQVDDTGRNVLRGLLHEITDIRPHQTNYALAMAKKFAANGDPSVGRALIDLTTGIVLDWVTQPKGPLDPWNQEIPEYSTQGREQADNLRKRVLNDSSLYVEFDTQLRFSCPNSQWFDATIGFEHHGANQGIMTVRETATELNQQVFKSA